MEPNPKIVSNTALNTTPTSEVLSSQRTIWSCLIYHIAPLVQRYPFSWADFASKEQTFTSSLAPISMSGLYSGICFILHGVQAKGPGIRCPHFFPQPSPGICRSSGRFFASDGACLDCNPLGGQKCFQTAWFGVLPQSSIPPLGQSHSQHDLLLSSSKVTPFSSVRENFPSLNRSAAIPPTDPLPLKSSRLGGRTSGPLRPCSRKTPTASPPAHPLYPPSP